MPSSSSPNDATGHGGDVACEVIAASDAGSHVAARDTLSGYAIGFAGSYFDNNFDEITLTL
jgi:hypothetical protein